MIGEAIFYKVESEPDMPLALAAYAAETDRRIDGFDVAPVLAAWQRPAVFLSASVREPRDDEFANIDGETRAWLDRHHPGWQTQLTEAIADEQPRRIARAVAWCCKFALANDFTLVFGGHPAISPMVLEIARNYIPGADEVRILVFQSEHFKTRLTDAARDLARWRHGAMLLTRDEGGQRVPSLTRMRRTMFGCPGLVAGVYIGGMSGVVEESRAFVDAAAAGAASRRRYAIAATGGAAKFLLEQDVRGHSGRGTDAELTRALADPGSYTALMTRIFDDIAAKP
jgi:hypothetical protein